ncbi:MAG: hypothetical protein ACRDYC_05830, partial [Acidimicrobiales bacterium]
MGKKLAWAVIAAVVISGCGTPAGQAGTFGPRSAVVSALEHNDHEISFDATAPYNQPSSGTSYWGNDAAEGFAVGLYGPSNNVTEI